MNNAIYVLLKIYQLWSAIYKRYTYHMLFSSFNLIHTKQNNCKVIHMRKNYQKISDVPVYDS